MDIATVLDEYLADIANLPADLAFVLDEIKIKDRKLVEVQRRINQRDAPIQKFVKTNGALQEYSKESTFYPRIRSDFQECILLQQEKTRLASMGLFLLAKHVTSLDKQVAQLEAEGTLLPINASQSSSFVSTVEPEPATKSRKASMAERRASRPEARHNPSRSGTADVHSSQNTPANSRHVTPALPNAPNDAASVSSSVPRRTSSTNGANSVTSRPSPPLKSETETFPVPVSLKRGQQSPRQRPPVLEESDEAFCFCKKGSVGNMIACDGKDCKIEWFHWDCVGLTEDPKGSWYCPDCRSRIKKIKEA